MVDAEYALVYSALGLPLIDEVLESKIVGASKREPEIER